MKIILIIMLLPSWVFSQTLSEDTVKGFVIHKYVYSGVYKIYCVGETIFVDEDKSLDYPLFENSIVSAYLIKENNIQHTFSDSLVTDYASFEITPKYDLTDNEYNFWKPKIKEVSSKQFYQEIDDTNIVKTAYFFHGVILRFEQADTFQSEDKLHEDCFCYQYIVNKTTFLSLKKVIDIKPLTTEQFKRLNLKKSKLDTIKLFFCE